MTSKKTKDLLSVKKNCGIQWTDNVFDKIYWSAVPRYRRPSADEVEPAVRYFLLHYAQGDGTAGDWQNTLRTLLLALRVHDANVDAGNDEGYVLANEDERKVEEQHLCIDESAVTATTVDKLRSARVPDRMAGWYNRCLATLEHGGTSQLATYFGCISLVLCQLIMYDAEYVSRHYRVITQIMKRQFQLPNVGNDFGTPTPSSALYETLSLVFTRFVPFANEIVCRLMQRRMRTQNAKVERLQNRTCYNHFRNCIALLNWYQLALKKLRVPGEQLLDMLVCIGHFESVTEVLRAALPLIDGSAEKSWQICRLLRKTAHPEWDINYEGNLLAVVTFVVIANDITASDDPFLKSLPIKRTPENLRDFELGISIGRSISKALTCKKQQKLQ